MNNPEVNLGVVGATGLVGEIVLDMLPKAGIEVGELRPFASERSAGQTIQYEGDEIVLRHATSPDSFYGLDYVIVSAGGDKTKSSVSKQVTPWIVEAGAVAVDNSSAFRSDPDVPLVVSEVNPEALDNVPKRIVANPNCTTMIAMVALKPLHDMAGLQTLSVSTYQSVSGQGKEGIVEMAEQTAIALASVNDFVYKGFDYSALKSRIFPVSPVFNAAPHCGDFIDDEETTEEDKFVKESRKILGLGDLAVMATCVRVPVLNSHSLSISAGFEKDISASEAKEVLAMAPGIRFVDIPNVPQPIVAAGIDEVLVGRVRADPTRENGLQLWVSGDNLRKGAALNAVQILELLASK